MAKAFDETEENASSVDFIGGVGVDELKGEVLKKSVDEHWDHYDVKMTNSSIWPVIDSVFIGNRLDVSYYG